MKLLTKHQIAHLVDHTNLDPEAKPRDIKFLVQEAITYQFGAVCVRSENVKIAKGYIGDFFPTKIVSVVGFPYHKSESLADMIADSRLSDTRGKVSETAVALSAGASEIDMVINLRDLKTDNYKAVQNDICAVVETAGKHIVKVILETGFLEEKYIVIGSRLAEQAGAAYVKTSTGFGITGASFHAIELMSLAISKHMGIKASGGIGTLQTANHMYAASQKYGIHPFRIGASSLVNEYRDHNESQSSNHY